MKHIVKFVPKKFWFYAMAIMMGIVCGSSGIETLEQLGKFCSEVFVRLFRCISMPIISLSVIVALSNFGANKSMNRIWKKTLTYTFTTTILAATVSAILYKCVAPINVSMNAIPSTLEKITTGNYVKYLIEVIPDNILDAFLQHKVFNVLLISLVVGISIQYIQNEDVRKTVRNFFEGLHSLCFTIITFIIQFLPIGLFGFIATGVMELNGSMRLNGIGAYFLVIVLANLLQGMLILPLFLLVKKLDPMQLLKGMLPALSVAFFSKSSTGTLPVTMRQAEAKLGVRKEISRFVLPICTTINMNGCATFIFTTVIYAMQNYGIEITHLTLLIWILIATIAAIGNAGVPMGCFFLSTSLLSSMNIPLTLMGIILPVYTIIDMLETALNVWSDSCIAAAVNQDIIET